MHGLAALSPSVMPRVRRKLPDLVEEVIATFRRTYVPLVQSRLTESPPLPVWWFNVRYAVGSAPPQLYFFR